jgi:hypothetical protein
MCLVGQLFHEDEKLAGWYRVTPDRDEQVLDFWRKQEMGWERREGTDGRILRSQGLGL